jgi:hypothetical protein
LSKGRAGSGVDKAWGMSMTVDWSGNALLPGFPVSLLTSVGTGGLPTCAMTNLP